MADIIKRWTAIALVIITVYLLHAGGRKISNLRACGDEQCKNPIAKGVTLITYAGDDKRILSFRKNVRVTIYSKSAGTNKDLWGGEINGKRGYFPKRFIKETGTLKRDLIDVPTEEDEVNISEIPQNVAESDKSSTTKVSENSVTSSPKHDASSVADSLESKNVDTDKVKSQNVAESDKSSTTEVLESSIINQPPSDAASITWNLESKSVETDPQNVAESDSSGTSKVLESSVTDQPQQDASSVAESPESESVDTDEVKPQNESESSGTSKVWDSSVTNLPQQDASSATGSPESKSVNTEEVKLQNESDSSGTSKVWDSSVTNQPQQDAAAVADGPEFKSVDVDVLQHSQSVREDFLTNHLVTKLDAEDSVTEKSYGENVKHQETFSSIIKGAWSSVKGTKMLSLPLESFQTVATFGDALTHHAEKLSNTLFKGLLVSAENPEVEKMKPMSPYEVIDGTTIPINKDSLAGEVEYARTSSGPISSEQIVVGSSLNSLAFSSVVHQSTPTMSSKSVDISLHVEGVKSEARTMRNAISSTTLPASSKSEQRAGKEQSEVSISPTRTALSVSTASETANVEPKQKPSIPQSSPVVEDTVSQEDRKTDQKVEVSASKVVPAPFNAGSGGDAKEVAKKSEVREERKATEPSSDSEGDKGSKGDEKQNKSDAEPVSGEKTNENSANENKSIVDSASERIEENQETSYGGDDYFDEKTEDEVTVDEDENDEEEDDDDDDDLDEEDDSQNVTERTEDTNTEEIKEAVKIPVDDSLLIETHANEPKTEKDAVFENDVTENSDIQNATSENVEIEQKEPKEEVSDNVNADARAEEQTEAVFEGSSEVKSENVEAETDAKDGQRISNSGAIDEPMDKPASSKNDGKSVFGLFPHEHSTSASLIPEIVPPLPNEEADLLLESAAAEAGDIGIKQPEEITESTGSYLDIELSPKYYLGLLRSYMQFLIDMLPEFMRAYIVEVENHGLSPRVLVLTSLIGFFITSFSSIYYLIKRGSKEGKLVERLCIMDKELFEAATERDVVKEDLKVSKELINKLETDLNNAQEAVELLDTDKSHSEDETKKLHDAIESLRDQLDLQTMTITNLRNNFEIKTEEHDKLVGEHDEAVIKIAYLEEELEKLRVKLEESEEERKTTGEQLTYFKSEMLCLEKNNVQLLEEAQLWNQRVGELQEQLELYKKSTENFEDALTLKEGELNALQECMVQLKIIQEDTDESSSETPLQKLHQLMDVSRVTAELNAVSMEKNSLIEKLSAKEKQSRSFEEQLQSSNDKVEQLSTTNSVLQQERDAAHTKLQVLTNYFKEKEIELQRELGVQEVKRQETQETALSITQQMELYEQEKTMHKSQIESLKKEIESQARSFKNQISQLETKAHDNWLATRAAERRAEEAKQEAAMLRNKLTLVEQEKELAGRGHVDGILKPTPQRFGGSNGEVPSPPQLDSGPMMDAPSSGPRPLLRDPLENAPHHLPFLPQDRPLPPPPLGFPPPSFMRERPLPPPHLFDLRGPLPPPPFLFDMHRRPPMLPPHLMDHRMSPPRDRFSPPPLPNRTTPPYDLSSPPLKEYRSPPPLERRNMPDYQPSPLFDRRPPSGRRMSPPPHLLPPDGRHYPPPPPYERDFRNMSPPRFQPLPPNHRTPVERSPQSGPGTRFPPAPRRDQGGYDNQKGPRGPDPELYPSSQSGGSFSVEQQDETTTAV